MDTLETIRIKALELMSALGEEHLGRSLLELGWMLKFSDAKRRLGVCKYGKRSPRIKVIALSRHYCYQGGWDLMEDVVRHEIAHAFEFEKTGRSSHGPGWKRLAAELGADPTRCFDGPLLPPAQSRYVGVCPSCGHEQPFYRRITRSYACVACCREQSGGRYSERFRLKINERGTGDGSAGEVFGTPVIPNQRGESPGTRSSMPRYQKWKYHDWN
jgi:predicted SprT family Zn-dependent metalloprotease